MTRSGRTAPASARLIPLCCALAALACDAAGEAKSAAPASAAPPAASTAAVTARGRLKPKGGVLRVAGPSDFVAVVAELRVGEGDAVRAGQVLARMDTLAVREARLNRARAQIAAQEATIARGRAELQNARIEDDRIQRLTGDGVLALSERDSAATRVKVAEAALSEAEAQLETARAELAGAQAERELAIVRAPAAGQVLKVHTHPGEKVGPEGILELARTQEMYAVAEVYETDVPRIRIGQRAVVRSAAFAKELEGAVERIGLKVGKLDALGTDPAARTDARVVEVEIRLDEAAAASGLTHLEVQIVFKP